MYQVLLVDDEMSITSSLQRSIEWSKYSLNVAAAVSNGQEALEVISREHIDIVITDIRMQNLGGLELCQQLHSQNPNIQIIIMSGYAEFSYAQRGIKYGIIGYCLKPIEYDELKMYLMRAVQKLKSAENLKTPDSLLDALLSNNTVEIRSCLNNLGFTEALFYTAVLSTDITPPRGDQFILPIGRKQFALLSKEPVSDSYINDFLCVKNNRCIGISLQAISANELSNVLMECQALAFQYFIDPEIRVCYGVNEDKANKTLNEISSITKTSLMIQMLQNIINDSTLKKSFTVKSAIRLCNIVCSRFALLNEEDFYIYSIEQVVNKYKSFDNLLKVMIDSLSIIEVPVSVQKSHYSNYTFLQMINYVTTHFTQDVSLTDIAEFSHLNPSYISQIFKKETGITFSKYLTELRINKAKQLLNASELSISDIAIKVGYNDYFYFLKIFKKATGLTPSQYRSGG